MAITVLDLCFPVTKRVMRYMQISQSLESAMSAATRAAFHVSRQHYKKYLSPPPRLPSTLPRGAAVSFRVLRPAYRGFVGTTRRASPSSSLSRVRFTPRRRARRIRSARRGAHRFIRGRLLRRDARRPHLDDRPRRSAIGTGKRTRGIDDAQRRGVAPSGPPIRKPRRRPVISPGAAKRR
jgi:hypothetical protein